ncbi:MAG: pyrophosphatase [Patescibacteria group bacterium]
MNQSSIREVTDKAKQVMQKYKEEYPDVKMDRDYLPFKITEEWGECLQTYLMLTDRGRQKEKTKDEIKDAFSKEIADVFAYLLLFAEAEGIDPIDAVNKKWFLYLEKD